LERLFQSAAARQHRAAHLLTYPPFENMAEESPQLFRKFRILLVEVVLLGLLVAWLMWKFPEVIDYIIPLVALLVAWHLTWEFILSTKWIRSKIRAKKERYPRMIWIYAFLLGGMISMFYLKGIKSGITLLNYEHGVIVSKQAKPEPPDAPDNKSETPKQKPDADTGPVPNDTPTVKPIPPAKPVENSGVKKSGQEPNFTTKDVAPEPTRLPSPSKYQGFHENPPETVYFSLGGGGPTQVVKTDALRSGRAVSVVNLDGFAPIRGHLDGDVLYCDVTLWGGPGVTPIQIHDNAFTVNRPDWDRNFTEDAFEVVNKDGVPMLQVIRKTPDHWVVNGVFVNGNSVAVASEAGLSVSMDMPTMSPEQHQRVQQAIRNAMSTLKPIFKYPSYQHKGEYADK
jgi:hypothetical protein